MPGLCSSCRHSITVQFHSSAYVYCTELSKRIPEPVEICSDFFQIDQIDKWQLEKIAWILDVSKPNQIGFIRPGTDEHKKLRGVSPLDD